MGTRPEGGVVTSATAPARQHDVGTVHVAGCEPGLDLAAAGAGGVSRGHGRLVPLARLHHLGGSFLVVLGPLLGLGQRVRRPGRRVLGPLLLDQGAEQLGRIVTAHPTFLSRSSAAFATLTRPWSSGPKSATSSRTLPRRRFAVEQRSGTYRINRHCPCRRLSLACSTTSAGNNASSM